MQESSLQINELVKSFKTIVKSIQTSFSTQKCQYFDAITQFGNMTVIVEEVADSSIEIYQQRKQLIHSSFYYKHFPLLYEQQSITINYPYEKHYILSLTQRVKLFQRKPHSYREQQFQTVVTCLLNLEDHPTLRLDESCLCMDRLLKSSKTNQLLFDFTLITLKQQQNVSEQDKAKQLIRNMIQLLPLYNESQALDEISLIKQKVYQPNYNLLQQARSWIQLSILLNFAQKITVQIAVTNIHSSLQQTFRDRFLGTLNGKQEFIYKNQTYSQFELVDGKCINIMVELSPKDLVNRFFVKNSVYILQKNNHAVIKRIKNQQEFLALQKQYDFLPRPTNGVPLDCLIVKENIIKMESINFFLTYFSHVKPTFTKLNFYADKNSLRLRFVTPIYPQLLLDIYFYSNYLVKDEEISMIVDKCNIDKGQLHLAQMQISDGLLLYLGNSEKMKRIQLLDISYCQNLTQQGLATFFISPLCKNIKQLNISGLPLTQTCAQAFNRKLPKLSVLKLNYCTDQQQLLNLSKTKLQKLQAISLNVELQFQQTLSILKLDCEVQLQSLKKLKNLSLRELKIRLVQKEKNIMHSFFSMKQTSAAKVFAEGGCRHTLRILDLSYSSVKLKQIRPILCMQSLQTLNLDNYQKIGSEVFHISESILNFSIQSTLINLHQLKQMLSKVKQLISLNVAETEIKIPSLIDYLYNHKKFLNILTIGQQQLVWDIFDSIKYNIQCIKIKISRLLDYSNQTTFNYLITKIVISQKAVFFLTDRLQQKNLINHLKKLYNGYQNEIPKNLFINEKSKNIFITERKKLSQYFEVDGHRQLMFLPQETVDTFIYYFIKCIREHEQQKLIGVCLSNNLLIGSQCIKILDIFGRNKIKWIDFQNCHFTFPQIFQILYRFPYLQTVNQNKYQIDLVGENYVEISQKYLKFFMKVHSVKELKIRAIEIQESDLLSTVLFHILDYHYLSLTKISLNLTKINFTQSYDMLFSKLLEINNLDSLELIIQQCTQTYRFNQFFHKLNNVQKLREIKLQVPARWINELKLDRAISLSIDFKNQLISQNLIGKVLCQCPSLQKIDLNFDGTNLSNLHKIKFISKFLNLQRIQLSFQYCPLKENTLFDLVESFKQLKCLRKLQINCSFAIQNIFDLLKSFVQLKEYLPHLYIKAFCINEKSNQFVYNNEQMLLRGIECIL